MGCAGSKTQAGTGEGVEAGQGSSGEDKARTFRERRLSMNQLPVPNGGNGGNRRMSLYGTQLGEDAQPTVVVSPMATCGCKTIGGVEPVPGGSVAKINQDRGLAIYPWNEEERTGLFGVYDGHGRVGEKVSEFVIQNLPPNVATLGSNRPRPFGFSRGGPTSTTFNRSPSNVA